jgi:tetratricopeptide (TPR) repeat protein
MKRFVIFTLAVLIAGWFSLAQAQQPAQGGAAQGQAAQAQPQATQGRPQPKITSQAEYKAYQDAAAKQTPSELELAAMEFEMKFPQSDVRTLLFLNAMRAYEREGNSEKTVEMARKVLTIYPNEPDAELAIANELASRTRDTDLDREERLTEATNMAKKALDNVNYVLLPANATPEQAEGIKNLMRSMAHAAMGTVNLTRKDPAAAEKEFETATTVNTAYPDPVVWLRLALSREQQKKYPGALDAVNEAVKLAPAGSQVATLAAAQRDRLQKMVEGGGQTQSPANPASPAPAPTSPAPAPSPAPTPTPQ